MLRAADHTRPLVNATSSFLSPLAREIEVATRSGPVRTEFLDLLEGVPVSYLVIHDSSIPPERRTDFESFLGKGIASGRLRLIRSFGERDDLYALTKVEPQAESEVPLPFALLLREWDALLRESPVYLLGQYVSWSQQVYHLHVATYGRMPRYADFIGDMQSLSRDVILGAEAGEYKKFLRQSSGL